MISSPEEVLGEDCVDMICVGEGEKCLVGLGEKMAKGLNYSDVDNIWIKTALGTIKNKKAPLS